MIRNLNVYSSNMSQMLKQISDFLESPMKFGAKYLGNFLDDWAGFPVILSLKAEKWSIFDSANLKRQTVTALCRVSKNLENCDEIQQLKQHAFTIVLTTARCDWLIGVFFYLRKGLPHCLNSKIAKVLVRMICM